MEETRKGHRGDTEGTWRGHEGDIHTERIYTRKRYIYGEDIHMKGMYT